MEKLASSTATVPTQHLLFQLHHSLFPFPSFFSTFHRTQSLSHLSFHTSHHRLQSLPNKQDQLWISEQDLQLQLQEAEAEEEQDLYLDNHDDSSFLSLSDKPDRNMAMLDEYETEELDFHSGPDHRSGSC